MMLGHVDRFKVILLLSAAMLVFPGIPPASAAPKPAPQSWLTSLFGGEEIEATGENLFKAAKDGRLNDVKDLVERGVDVNYGGGVIMGVAAEYGKFETVKYLLEAGGNANGSNEYPHYLGSVIQAAGKNNHVDIIDLLLEHGATVKTPKYGVGVLDRAAENGHLEAVQRLLDAGADPDFGRGYSLLLPAKHGHLDVVKAFIKAGADVNAGGGWIINNAAEEGHLEIVRTLIEAGIDKDDLGYALSRAASVGELEIIRLLLENGADPNTGRPLEAAAKHGSTEVVKALIEAGSKITYDTDGEQSIPPLFSAASNGHTDVIALLVENGADINQVLGKDLWWDLFTPYDANYGNGWTVLHTVSRFGFPVIQELFDLGVNMDAKDVKGRTALQIAVHYENLLVVKDFLRFCANTTLTDNKGTTVFDLARNLALKNPSNSSAKYKDLKTLMKEVMPERLASTPSNDKAISALKEEFLSMMEANATLKAQVGEDVDRLDVYNAIHYVLKDQARAEITSVLEAHTCQLSSSEDHQVIPLGSKHLIMCDCIPGQGPQLTFSEELNQCPSDSAPE